MNDPSNPGRVYNTDDRLKSTVEREPPPKPVRKPDPSLRQLQRQISIGQVENSFLVFGPLLGTYSLRITLLLSFSIFG